MNENSQIHKGAVPEEHMVILDLYRRFSPGSSFSLIVCCQSQFQQNQATYSARSRNRNFMPLQMRNLNSETALSMIVHSRPFWTLISPEPDVFKTEHKANWFIFASSSLKYIGLISVPLERWNQAQTVRHHTVRTCRSPPISWIIWLQVEIAWHRNELSQKQSQAMFATLEVDGKVLQRVFPSVRHASTLTRQRLCPCSFSTFSLGKNHPVWQ